MAENAIRKRMSERLASREKLGPCLLLAAVLALSFLVFEPGISMSDTLARWAGAYTIVGKLEIPWGLELWLAPTMTWFMVPFAATEFAGPYFHAAQVFCLLLGGISWIYFTSSARPWWVAVPFMIPLVFAYTSFIVPDVWTLTAILGIVGSLYALERSARVLVIFVFPLSCVILFGFRQNSLVLLPFVWLFIAKLQNGSKALKFALAATTLAALGVINWVPSTIGFQGATSSAAAPAWELLGAISVAREIGLELDPAVTLDGIADTTKAVEEHSFVTIDTVLWGENAAIPTTAIMAHADEIKSRWFRLILRHPMLYLRTKVRIYKCMLGLCQGYLQTRIACVKPWPVLQDNLDTCVPDSNAANVLNKLNRIQGPAQAVLLPIFWLPLSIVVFFFAWRGYGPHDRMVICLATAYLGSFFLLNQAASFRYLLPTYVVFTAYQIRFLLELPSRFRTRHS